MLISRFRCVTCRRGKEVRNIYFCYKISRFCKFFSNKYMFEFKLNHSVQRGCVSFFCTEEGGGSIQEKRRGEKREHESQEDQTRTESPDATGERRIARCAG